MCNSFSTVCARTLVCTGSMRSMRSMQVCVHMCVCILSMWLLAYMHHSTSCIRIIFLTISLSLSLSPMHVCAKTRNHCYYGLAVPLMIAHSIQWWLVPPWCFFDMTSMSLRTQCRIQSRRFPVPSWLVVVMAYPLEWHRRCLSPFTWQVSTVTCWSMSQGVP